MKPAAGCPPACHDVWAAIAALLRRVWPCVAEKSGAGHSSSRSTAYCSILYPRFPDISSGCRLYYQLTVLPLVSRSGGFLRHGVAMPLGLGFPRYSRFDHVSPHERAILLTIRAGETAIGVIVQIAEAPRCANAGRTIEIEGRATP